MTETGIWQGRFQYIHKGHTHIFDTELSKFKNKMIAIVNPNPAIPAKNFERFGISRNPFSYFERMFLWKKYAESVGVEVTIFPCWHARYIVALENEFLPSRNTRSWIIPLSQDDSEEEKSDDLRNLGENVFNANYMEEPAECRAISATMIRRCFAEKNYDYRKYIPECICSYTEKFALFQDETTYYAVPIIDDCFEPCSIQAAINHIKNDDNAYALFVVTVHVSPGEFSWINESNLPWWFKKAKSGYVTYYKKAQIINSLMRELGLSNFLIVPLFVMDNDLNVLREYNDTFLPKKINNVKWVVNEHAKDMYKNNFFMYLDNIEAENNIICIANDTQIEDILENFKTSYSSYIYKSSTTVDNSAQKSVFQKWFDKIFDKKDDYIKDRIEAGYSSVLEEGKRNALEQLRVELQRKMDCLFQSSVDESIIIKFKQEILERLELL